MARERNDIIFENQRVIIPSSKKEIISIYDDEKNDTPYRNKFKSVKKMIFLTSEKIK